MMGTGPWDPDGTSLPGDDEPADVATEDSATTEDRATAGDSATAEDRAAEEPLTMHFTRQVEIRHRVAHAAGEISVVLVEGHEIVGKGYRGIALLVESDDAVIDVLHIRRLDERVVEKFPARRDGISVACDQAEHGRGRGHRR